jgi:hypothetical protein
MNMRKINNIWHTIWLVIGISLFILGCPFKSGVEGKAWFRYASKYDQTRSKTIANAAAKKEGFLQDITEMEKIKQSFLRARQPTETEMIFVLRSPDRRFQRVGLVAMSLKPIETDQLTDILFEFLQDQDKEFRWYAVSSLEDFTKISESKKAGLGKQLLGIIKNESDQEILIRKFSLFAKFPCKEAVPFLTEQLMKEGRGNYLVRHFAFTTLKKMGNSFYDEAADYVNNHGSPETKKDLLDLENNWEITNTPTGKK